MGTFEIRKYYGLLISIWQELVKDPQFHLDLVIVGMPGWQPDNVIDQLQKSDLFGKRIYWFKRLSDAGLAWLYTQCHVFFYPSLY